MDAEEITKAVETLEEALSFIRKSVWTRTPMPKGLSQRLEALLSTLRRELEGLID